MRFPRANVAANAARSNCVEPSSGRRIQDSVRHRLPKSAEEGVARIDTAFDRLMAARDREPPSGQVVPRLGAQYPQRRADSPPWQGPRLDRTAQQLAGRHIDERKGGARWRCNKSIGGADLIEVGQGGLFALSSKWLPLSMV